MDIYLLQSFPFRKLQKPVKMRIVAVDAAIGQKSHDMQRRAVPAAVLHALQQRRIPEEISVLNALGNARQFLVDDPSGTHVQMADFGIAHLSVRQSDRQSGGISLNKGTLLHQPVKIRCIRQSNRIVLSFFTESESVHDH